MFNSLRLVMDSVKPRVLFFAEAVTLAHVTRPIVLAKALDTKRYDVQLACDPRYLSLFGELPFQIHPIYSMSFHSFTEKQDDKYSPHPSFSPRTGGYPVPWVAAGFR